MSFLTDLIVTPRARGMWELVLPLVFIDSDGNRYEIPAGFTCDRMVYRVKKYSLM